MSLIDDAIVVQERCLMGLHRWALVAIPMPGGYLKPTGGEICLDCHERKPYRREVLHFPSVQLVDARHDVDLR